MQIQKLVPLFVVLIFVGLFPDQSTGCELHEKQAASLSSSALPETSVYHLTGKWLTPEGKPVGFEDLHGPVRIAAMVFTSCPTACPMLIQDMKDIRAKLPENMRKRVQMTVLSFDSERDTPEALKKFTEKMKLEDEAWLVLTPVLAADATELAAVLGVQFKKLDSGDYIHSNSIFLIDEHGEVIAKKDGLKSPAADFIAKVSALPIPKNMKEKN